MKMALIVFLTFMRLKMLQMHHLTLPYLRTT